MPLSKENRVLLEVAIISYLTRIGQATSKDIYAHLKWRGFLALKGTKQVSMICLAFEKRGAIFSTITKVKDGLRVYKKKYWRINPNFHKDHPHQTMFSSRVRPSELEKIRKGRVKS